MPKPGKLLILGDLEQMSQGQFVLSLITGQLFDLRPSNLIQRERLRSPKGL